jgi:hypothetical protein
MFGRALLNSDIFDVNGDLISNLLTFIYMNGKRVQRKAVAKEKNKYLAIIDNFYERVQNISASLLNFTCASLKELCSANTQRIRKPLHSTRFNVVNIKWSHIFFLSRLNLFRVCVLAKPIFS